LVVVSVIVLELDGDLAGHLAVAVRRHREMLDHVGRACPDELVALERVFVTACNGQGVSGAFTPLPADSVGGMTADWLTPRQAARMTSLSLSTIRRSVADGSLTSTKVGRSRRIAVEDLNEFMGGRRRGAHA
jgi:excisionase family DNA binding protein